MHFVDWLVVSVFFLLYIVVAYYFHKKAVNTKNFFLSGQNLPWYIAGTSMVATTFAADTPLAVTELVAQNGIAGNWLWWNMLLGGMLTVFFFARLWRRAGIMTDCEFVTLRYSGKPAHFLRGFRAIYIGVFMNTIVIAWVNLAMVKILTVLFPNLTFMGYTEWKFLGFELSAQLLWVGVAMLFIALYSTLSGLMGTAITDTIQFTVAMVGCIILAIIAVQHPVVGGIEGIKSKLPESVFSFFPIIENSTIIGNEGVLHLSLLAFITYLGVQWWASWYPGAEPGGGGYIAQRIMSAKNEKHSVWATMWFQIAHFAVRPWPWIIVALVSLVLYPDLPANQKGDGFVYVIRDLMPTGVLGLLVAAFFAAYMSTIASQTLWGTSYIINDLFKPYIKPGKTEKYYVNISRITIFMLVIFSLLLTSKLNRISDAWKFILECSAGIGPVLLLRWYWWRINAWSEISALLAPFLIYPILINYQITFPDSLLIILLWSTLVWIIVTFLTKPTDKETLQKFYEKVKPEGRGWKKITNVKEKSNIPHLLMLWFISCLIVLFMLFFIGKIILQEFYWAAFYIIADIIFLVLLIYLMKKLSWNK
ncbi:MAG: Na+:solute symporter [Bacteroidales bacterium]|nr:Na+:solute symporter [Bacteroidales bacterium]